MLDDIADRSPNGGSPATPAEVAAQHRAARDRARLPSFPLLRANVPLLRRSAHDIQIGLDAGALVVESAPAGLARILASLDGAHQLSEIEQRAQRCGVAPKDLVALLDRLAAAGLLVDRPHRPGRAPRAARIVLLGAGASGRALAGLLGDPRLVSPGIGVRIGELVLVDPTPVDRATYPDAALPADRGAAGRPAGLTNAEALCVALDANSAGPLATPRISVAHSSTGERDGAARPHLVVVCSGQLEADRLALDELMRADLPHLLVSTTASGWVVGPLVLPGRSACVRCTDLVRRDADPAWPRLLAQLSRLPARASAGSLGWAAGVASAQILAFLAGQVPETVGATLELSAIDFATRLRRWRAHPECGCRWQEVGLA